MRAQKIEIRPMQAEDVPTCFMSWPRLFFPNRLRNPSMTVEQRFQKHCRGMEADLQSPALSLFVGKLNGEIVGWTSWVKPDYLVAEAGISSHQPIVREKDEESDAELLSALGKARKAMRDHFFGDQPSW